MLTLLLSCIAHYHEKVFVSESLGCRRGSSEGLQQTPNDPGGVALPRVHPACIHMHICPSQIGRQIAWPVMCVVCVLLCPQFRPQRWRKHNKNQFNVQRSTQET